MRDGFDLFWKVDASLVHKVGQYKNGKGLALCERSTKTVFLRVIDLMINKINNCKKLYGKCQHNMA